MKIEEYLLDVFEDFKKEIEKMENLCSLKTLNYEQNNKPDYSDKMIQQFYLLRYAFGYGFEYQVIFLKLLSDFEFDKTIEITSIGCGNMIDYWAMEDALARINKNYLINYKGVDRVDWNYKFPQREGDDVQFFQEDIVDYLERQECLTSDIYMFPMSISEFDEKQFEKICQLFSEKAKIKERIHIIVPLRSNEYSLDMDNRRTEQLLKGLESSGFVLIDEGGPYYIDGDSGICTLDRRFKYPDKACEYLKRLQSKCKEIFGGGEKCESCEEELVRYPVLKTNNVRFRFLNMHRKV